MAYCIKSVLIVALISLATPVAQAQEDAGFSVNLGLGISRVKDRDGMETFNASDVGWTLGGEYRFNQYFAIGFNTFSLGSPKDQFDGANTAIEVNGYDFVVRFILPASETVELFALAGTAVYTADLKPGGNNGLFGDDALELGLGVDFATTDSFAIRLAGRYYNGPSDESGSLLTVGFNYRFGR